MVHNSLMSLAVVVLRIFSSRCQLERITSLPSVSHSALQAFKANSSTHGAIAEILMKPYYTTDASSATAGMRLLGCRGGRYVVRGVHVEKSVRLEQEPDVRGRHHGVVFGARNMRVAEGIPEHQVG